MITQPITLTPELLESVRIAAIEETRLAAAAGNPAIMLTLVALANDCYVLGKLKEEISHEYEQKEQKED